MSLGKPKIPNMKFLYYMITIMCALKLQPATCNPQPATCKLDIFLIQGIQIGFYVWTLVGCIYLIASSPCNTLCWTLKDHKFENSSMVWVCRLSFPLGTRKLNLVSFLFDKPFLVRIVRILY
jgi:hypothetical protein